MLCGLLCIWPLCFHVLLTYALKFRLVRRDTGVPEQEIRVGSRTGYGSAPAAAPKPKVPTQ